MVDPPTQDLSRLRGNSAIKVVEGAENRTIFLGFDQARDELLKSNVKGKNPFKDVRVRRAFLAAIDVEAIKTPLAKARATQDQGDQRTEGIDQAIQNLNK